MSVFSNRLKVMRENAGWTKTYVANRLHLPLTTYANYEYGNREPDINTIGAISTLFNTSNDYLMGKTDNPEPKSSNLSSTDLEDMLDNAHSYDGKPMDDHDRALIKQYLEALFSQRDAQK